MKGCKILLILIFFSSCVLAGDFKAGLFYSFGYANMQIKSESFDVFKSTYNNNPNNQNALLKGFTDRSSNASGWFSNIGFMMGDGFGMAGNFGLSKTNSVNDAVFKNGEKRRIVLHYNDFNVDMGLGVVKGAKFYIVPVFGIYARFSSLRASYIFRDGTESFGDDRALNGIYTALRLTGDLGVQAGFKILPHVQLAGRVDFIYKPVANPPYLEGYTDYSYVKDQDFPQDYNVTPGVDNNLLFDSHGPRITLSLQFYAGDSLDDK